MRRVPAAWRAWALALACAALAHGVALWWVGAAYAPSAPATPVQDLATMAVRMMAAPARSASTVAEPPATVAKPRSTDALAPRRTASPNDPVTRAAATPRPASGATPSQAHSESVATPSADGAAAETAPSGTGFRQAGPRGDAPTRQLDLNLRSNTYTHTPTLAERSAGQIDSAPAPVRGTGAAQVTESRGASGYRARVRTPLGEYCLKRKNPAMQGMSDRPADNTALPTSCD